MTTFAEVGENSAVLDDEDVRRRVGENSAVFFKYASERLSRRKNVGTGNDLLDIHYRMLLIGNPLGSLQNVFHWKRGWGALPIHRKHSLDDDVRMGRRRGK